jgi:hypothetical protein
MRERVVAEKVALTGRREQPAAGSIPSTRSTRADLIAQVKGPADNAQPVFNQYYSSLSITLGSKEIVKKCSFDLRSAGADAGGAGRLRGCSLNQRSVEFSLLYTTRSSLDLAFKQSIQKRVPIPVVVAEPQSVLAAALFDVTGKISVDTALSSFIIILIR